ncbi:hypothetical protein [Pseudomonas sp. zfem002]|uniref:hypothetical protein n=1 Tax=Pseudomonas sp. zfem002 TaxID=3078197 RepID=UPI0029282081|nr:hypothetical protein [Pseudomonas sp. zfem002]MDU9394048.1 hypothetical protein [Pseudomonas sp. zfem002]
MAGNQDNQGGKQGGMTSGTPGGTGSDKDKAWEKGRQGGQTSGSEQRHGTDRTAEGGQRGKDMSGDNKPDRSTDMDQPGRQGGGKDEQKR